MDCAFVPIICQSHLYYVLALGLAYVLQALITIRSDTLITKVPSIGTARIHEPCGVLISSSPPTSDCKLMVKHS